MTTSPKPATTKTLPPRRRMFAPAVEANEHGAVLPPPASLGAGSAEAHTAGPVPSKPSHKPRKSVQQPKAAPDDPHPILGAPFAAGDDVAVELAVSDIDTGEAGAALKTFTVFDTPEPRTYVDPSTVTATVVPDADIADIMAETAAAPQSNSQTAESASPATDAPTAAETPILAHARKPRKRRDTAREDAIDVKIATERLAEMASASRQQVRKSVRPALMQRYGMRPARSYIGRPYGKGA